eukprot:gene17952-biopygen11428
MCKLLRNGIRDFRPEQFDQINSVAQLGPLPRPPAAARWVHRAAVGAARCSIAAATRACGRGGGAGAGAAAAASAVGRSPSALFCSPVPQEPRLVPVVVVAAVGGGGGRRRRVAAAGGGGGRRWRAAAESGGGGPDMEIPGSFYWGSRT